MKYLIVLLFALQIIPCKAHVKTNYQLSSDNLCDLKVNSLFSNHIKSLKSTLENGILPKKEVSNDDILFLDFFYYISGIQVEREHLYGTLPLYIKSSEIHEIESWYSSKKEKIVWDNVGRIYFLMSQIKSVKANNLDELELIYNEIEKELLTLRIN